ncbi:MAG TPA: Holliday junction branch migration protein RuvA [Microthrixaceae bacterium]|nr:Holliday junction branch migration protein RuvA [Microthrixaceae bacterium]
MIGPLPGRLLARSGGDLVIEVGGLGYRVTTTPATSGALGAEGGEVFVWVHHHLREDAQTLYGFATLDERDVFETLIGTHGVGPALGLAILATHEPRGLRLALATDDLAALCLVPGVGKKTAQRLLVELKSRLDLGEVSLDSLAADAVGAPTASATPHPDVREAVGGLGYSAAGGQRAVRSLPADGDSSELLRHALRFLAAG